MMIVCFGKPYRVENSSRPVDLELPAGRDESSCFFHGFLAFLLPSSSPAFISNIYKTQASNFPEVGSLQASVSLWSDFSGPSSQSAVKLAIITSIDQTGKGNQYPNDKAWFCVQC